MPKKCKLKDGYVFVFQHPRRSDTAQIPQPKPPRHTFFRVPHYVKYLVPLLKFSMKG